MIQMPSSASSMPTHSPAVSRPRTRLLRKGWRRRGLLDPADVPGQA
jgi:hypothetical protein